MNIAFKKARFYALCGLSALFLLLIPVQAQNAPGSSNLNPLVEALQAKGILTAADVAKIDQAGTGQEANLSLARILLAKGLISQADYDRLAAENASAANAQPTQANTAPKHASSSGYMEMQSPPHPTEPGAPAVIAQAPSKEINVAISPVRVFPVGGVKTDRNPAFKADGVGLDPYGFVKATAVFDSSDPSGDDFPLPGFLSANSGPNGDPEFHLKARATRLGLNLNWYDPSTKWDITGKIEMDFEGNFNRSDNRNVSTIRSSNPSLRLAWGRMDYHFDKNNSVSALFGQDWTLYGSSTMPNILETTFFGAYYGFLYERDPQMRVGFTHKSGGFTIMPEFAINLPASGNPPSAANISNELGYGERQGPDSDRPNYQARIVGQWQLDHAPGVAPAQIVFSGFDGKRTANALSSAVTATAPAYATTFSHGVSASSKQDGWDAEFQLPTRWFTLVGKYYAGSDLRWFFAGQAYSFYSDTTGLTATATVASDDGGSNIILGTNAAHQQVVAPERPVRAAGGVVQLGLPLSRIFHADPAGRNAGWTLYATYGVDQAKERDVNRATTSASRHGATVAAGTLNYKLDKWISFTFEQSLYTEHANTEQSVLPLFKGVQSREWNDVREEFGPVFVF
jgi:hypothetical protein